MKRLVLTLILAALVLTSVSGSVATTTRVETDGVCFLTVLKLKDSGYSEEQNLVINNSAEWQSVWEKIFANTSAKPPLPEVDFGRRTIIAAFQGAQATGGYEISIEEIAESERSLAVIVKAFAPGNHCVVEAKVTRPLDIVEIEKTEKEVVFHVKHKIRDCQ